MDWASLPDTELYAIASHLSRHDLLALALSCSRFGSRLLGITRTPKQDESSNLVDEALRRFWFDRCCEWFECRALFDVEIDWLAHARVIDTVLARYSGFLKLADADGDDATTTTTTSARTKAFSSVFSTKRNRSGNTALHSLVIDAGLLKERERGPLAAAQVASAIDEIHHVLLNLGLDRASADHHDPTPTRQRALHEILATNNDRQQSVLHVAARCGLASVVARVLPYLPQISVPDVDGCTPLSLAVISGDLDTVQLLFQHAIVADRQLSSHRDVDAWNILHTAACFGHDSVIQWLAEQMLGLDDGAKLLDSLLNAVDTRNVTPLGIASESAQWHAGVALLAAQRACGSHAEQRPPVVRSSEHSLIHALAMAPEHSLGPDSSVAEALMERVCQYSDPNCLAVENIDPASAVAQQANLALGLDDAPERATSAFSNSQPQALSHLERISKRAPYTPLHACAKYSAYPALARVLLRHSANVNAVTADTALTPLHLAAFNLGHGREIAELLCDAGADCSARSSLHSLTPLHCAAQEMNLELVRFLAARDRGSVNVTNRQGNTALHLVCSASELLTARALRRAIEAAKEPHLRRDPPPPFVLPNYASANNEAARVNVPSQASANLASVVAQSTVQGSADGGTTMRERGDSPITLPTLMEFESLLAQFDVRQSSQTRTQGAHLQANPALPQQPPIEFDTSMPFNVQSFGTISNVFHTTAAVGIRLPSLSGARPAVVPRPQPTEQRGVDPAAIAEAELVRWLIEETGADINVENTFRETPLHCCCRRGKLEVAKVLVEKGAAIGALDCDGMPAPMYAAKRGSIALFRWLLEQCGPEQAKSIATMPDHVGNTVLHWFAALGNLESVQWLVEVVHVDPLLTNHHQQTARMVATESNQRYVEKWLYRFDPEEW